ncbi:luciferase domain-containing protein [Nonomuraea africana]|uniref:Phospholipase/carboxylesterase n=1 Tax=Nonomuraea africana TaxID=46171 RepID=A0ABR9KF08_9ACTN|nr:luciferase family protein [Nonomuraea africana]MBE1560603.1 phospholipase/carboxylesterase [Nonomuraea africana]
MITDTRRRGPRPATRPTTPHQQLDQTAPARLQEELWLRMAALPGVRTGRSGISLPDTRALHLTAASGPADAYLIGAEFAHLHGARDGSLHLSLPEAGVRQAIERGWAEPHPAVAMGLVPPTIVMVYGPRDDEELEVVWGLVQDSHAFATGSLRSGSGGSGPRP